MDSASGATSDCLSGAVVTLTLHPLQEVFTFSWHVISPSGASTAQYCGAVKHFFAPRTKFKERARARGLFSGAPPSPKKEKKKGLPHTPSKEEKKKSPLPLGEKRKNRKTSKR